MIRDNFFGVFKRVEAETYADMCAYVELQRRTGWPDGTKPSVRLSGIRVTSVNLLKDRYDRPRPWEPDDILQAQRPTKKTYWAHREAFTPHEAALRRARAMVDRGLVP